MPAPKNPNVTSAAAARRRIGDLTASNRLTAAGYLVLSPEDLAQLPESLRAELHRWLARGGQPRAARPAGTRGRSRPGDQRAAV
jgi:hypothetical protein